MNFSTSVFAQRVNALREARTPTTPAPWSALLLCGALALQGCSVLAPQRAAEEEGTPAEATADPTFSLQVQAPETVRDTLERHLELQRFRLLPDLQTEELRRLLHAADANARELLGTLGYFAPTIAIDLRESAEGTQPPYAVTVTVDPGPQTRITQADITFTEGAENEPDARVRQLERVQRNWSLPAGSPFTQGGWSDAKNTGLRQLQARRYPTASIANSRAEVDADTHEARLAVAYDPGPAYRFGPLQVRGNERYDPDGARRLARLPTGSIYDEAEMLDAQQRLAASGYYDAVFLTLDTDAANPQAAPVIAQVREAKLQKLVFGVGVSTDSGPRLSIDHTHNQWPTAGWRAINKLSLDKKAQQLGTGWTALPDDNGWRWFTSALAQRQQTGDYDVNSVEVQGGRSKSTDNIDRTYFLRYDTTRAQGLNAPANSAALSANYGWTGRYFNSNTAPTRGYGIAVELGAGVTLRPERAPFTRTLVRWQSFFPAGRVEAANGVARNARIAVRTEAGAVLARNSAEIPVTQLFLTGGDTTVRGYGYRAIGARTDNNQLYGGRYMAVASVEWQRPFVYGGSMTDWENTFFVDAGAVADRAGDLDPRVGVGTGVRWRSPVGPLQADLAWGVQSKKLRLHLRLGFTF
jgi:translocation and assembly module TamA